MRRRRTSAIIWLGLAVTVAWGAALPGSALADHGETACQGQDVPITRWTVRDAELTSLCLLNLYRQANGLGPLTLEPSLLLAARGHSFDMRERNYFGHEAPAPAPSGTTPRDRATSAGYREDGEVGENIGASGRVKTTPHDVFNGWRASEGNDANMLDGYVPYDAAAIGIVVGAPRIEVDGRPLGPKGVTGTQLFGTLGDGGTETALGLAGGDPRSAVGCEVARLARHDAKVRWEVARNDRDALMQKRRLSGSKKQKLRLKKQIKRKREQIAQRRATFRRLSHRWRVTCPSETGKKKGGGKKDRGEQGG
jgi:uncharacterized protein YkwD